MSRKKNVLIILLIAIIIIMGIGTYSFFTADIIGNIEEDQFIKYTGTLEIAYTEGQNINVDKIRPGWSGNKTFTVKNNGTLPSKYDIVFDDLVNTFIKDEIIYDGTCTSNQGACDSIVENTFKDDNFYIKQNITIEPNEEHFYEIKVVFFETNENQNYNKAAELSGKIEIYETDNYTLASNIEVDIVDNMIPISWDETTLIKADLTNQDNNWYDYDNQKWANAVLVTEESRENYKSSAQGTEIIEDDILAYYTYVPRYRYQLWNTNNNENCLMDNCDEQEIQVRFETKTSTKTNGSTNGEWLTHPAFSFGEKELNGIWVGKFITSPDPNSTCYTSPGAANCDVKSLTPRVKPNMDMWRYPRVATMFSVTKQIETNNMYGLNSYENADSHMMKNMEWGAVAYLSHSKYGKYGNDNYVGEDKQLYINNYRADNPLTYKTETGCSGGSPNAPANLSSCPYSYPDLTLEATGASTAGNIYGIYDMSGGAWEYVMGQLVKEGTDLGTFYSISSSGVWDEIPDLKYYDSYENNIDKLTHERGYLGDATRETLKTFGTSIHDGWYSDYSAFPDINGIWFVRGGFPENKSSSGAFAFKSPIGDPIGSAAFRVVLVIE